MPGAPEAAVKRLVEQWGWLWTKKPSCGGAQFRSLIDLSVPEENLRKKCLGTAEK